jgi:hypothetical protein
MNSKSIPEPWSKKKINSLRLLVKLMDQGYLFTYDLISARLFEEVMQLNLCAVFDQKYKERFEVIHEFPAQEDYP